MKLRRLHTSRRGFVLIAVIGVLATMIFLLFAAQGSVTQAHLIGRLDKQRAQVQAATNSALEQILARQGQLHPQAVLFREGAVSEVHISYYAVESAGSPIWQSVPSLAPISGDQLVRLDYSVRANIVANPRFFLINPAGHRAGALGLPANAIAGAYPQAAPKFETPKPAEADSQPETKSNDGEEVPVPDAAAAGDQ